MALAMDAPENQRAEFSTDSWMDNEFTIPAANTTEVVEIKAAI
jgi:hypothetical protein